MGEVIIEGVVVEELIVNFGVGVEQLSISHCGMIISNDDLRLIVNLNIDYRQPSWT